MASGLISTLRRLLGRQRIEKRLRVLIFKEENWWVAQVLEHDIAAQAHLLDELVPELMRTIAGTVIINHHAARRELEHIPRAPERYWKAFERVQLETQFRESLVPSAAHLPEITGRITEAAVR